MTGREGRTPYPTRRNRVCLSVFAGGPRFSPRSFHFFLLTAIKPPSTFLTTGPDEDSRESTSSALFADVKLLTFECLTFFADCWPRRISNTVPPVKKTKLSL
jgi:hypothetical protein